MSTALLLLPDFVLILLGFALRRWMHLGDHFWMGVEKLVYFIFFPALLLNAILKTRLELHTAAPLLASALLALAGGMLLAATARRWSRLPDLAFASIFQCGFRFNSYIGLATAGMLYGVPGIATMGLVLGGCVPIVNSAAVYALARHGETGVLKELSRNPLIIATISGLILNVAGFTPPAPLQAFLGRLADASIALGLIAVGAALRLTQPTESAQHDLGLPCSRGRAAALWMLAVKLACVPLFAAWIGQWFGLTGIYYKVLVIFAALPTASSAYILAMRMGGDGPRTAWLISANTLVAMVTLPLWAAWLANR